jgi:hypothetical protein
LNRLLHGVLGSVPTIILFPFYNTYISTLKANDPLKLFHIKLQSDCVNSSELMATLNLVFTIPECLPNSFYSVLMATRNMHHHHL